MNWRRTAVGIPGVLAACVAAAGAPRLAATSVEDLYRFAVGTTEWSSAVTEGRDGVLYGVIASSTGSGVGSIYRVLNGRITMLHALTSAEGPFSATALTLGDEDDLFGTTGPLGPVAHVAAQGIVGTGTGGTIFKLDPSSGQFSVIYRFPEGRDGLTPRGPLIRQNDGTLYGITFMPARSQFAGDSGASMFKLTGDGSLTLLHTFQVDSEGLPNSLIDAGDGLFYGTTVNSSANNGGTIFRVSAAGDFAVLHKFPAGARPAGVTMARDGNAYGTTSGGGGPDIAALSSTAPNPFVGTIFKVTSDGTLTTLRRLAVPDGTFPLSGLVEGEDGALYGTTSAGGQYGFGTLFKIATDGRFSVIQPAPMPGVFSSLSRGSNGKIHGVRTGALSSPSFVFRLSTRP